MRVTNSLFYTNATNNYQQNMQELYKTNAQIASGLKIQNSFEDSGVYVDAMRLNYEVATLEQVKESSSKAQTYTDNTDNVLNQFTDALDQFKTKLIQASNQSNSPTSLDAIANELSALKEHMISLGNTSINGQYLFSGTAFAVKPLDSNGNYKGNDGNIEAVIGSGVRLPYNVNGKDLFLGQDSDYSRVLSTNVKMLNQTMLHPDVMNGTQAPPEEVYINENDTIRDMVGDIDADTTNDPLSIFYLSGRKSDGTTFSSKMELSSSSKISDLLESIGQKYGNSSTNRVVDVKVNEHGQIEVKDLNDGISLLEMNLFGAVDRDAAGGTNGNANQANIDDLLAYKNVDIISFNKSNFKTDITAHTVTSRKDINSPETFRIGYPMFRSDGSFVDAGTVLNTFMPSDVDHIDIDNDDTNNVAVSSTVQDLMTAIETQYGLTTGSVRIENGQIIAKDPTGNLNAKLVSEDSSDTPTVGFATPDSMNYERRGFEKDGNTLSSNISQMVKSTNDFATNKTKLSEVAGVSLNAKRFVLSGIDNLGNSFDAQIDFGNPDSTFSLDGGANNYTIFDGSGGDTSYKDMTYRQLSDVVSMIISNKLPNDDDVNGTIDYVEYNKAVSDAKGVVEVGLDYRGRLEIYDKFNSISPIEFSMYDSNADKSTQASALTFMANDAVKIDDPNLDFYKDLDNMIEAVKTGTFRMDANSDNPRNTGIENSLQRIDHIMDHVAKEHTKIGSFSNALSQANERSELLSINVQTIRSKVIDVDIGEAYMKFNQLSNSYQATLSTVAKINSMSLLNYM